MSNAILLAEDSLDDVLFFKRALKRAGILNPVQVVKDGRDAIEYLKGEGPYADRQRFPEPSILFIDLLMPRADGWVVLNWLNTQPKSNALLVIVITGAEQFMRLQEAYGMGAHSFIFKPLQVAEIRGLIENWPERWLMKGPVADRKALPVGPEKPHKDKHLKATLRIRSKGVRPRKSFANKKKRR